MNNLHALLDSLGDRLEAVSVSSGIPVPRLQALAAGESASLEEARRIAAALKISIRDFAALSPSEAAIDVAFRRPNRPSLEKMDTSPEAGKFARRIRELLDIVGDKPAPPIWIRVLSSEVNELSAGSAERVAALFRRNCAGVDVYGPLLDLPTLLSEKLDTLVLATRNSSVDGASAVVGGRAFIFVSLRFAGRMLFSLAHEVGHLVAGGGAGNWFGVVDAEGAIDRPPIGERDELFADAFASALLMPPEGVGVALTKIREKIAASHNEIGDVELLYLSRVFGVSFAAAARRCESLGLLPRGGALSLNDHLLREFGSPERRAEMLGLPPRPEVEFPMVPSQLLGAAISKVQEGKMSIGRAADTLRLSVMDLAVSAVH